jgi:hypothetical protein
MMQVLTHRQVNDFLVKGYVKIPACFDRRLADEWRRLAWERVGYAEDDPATWSEARMHLPSMNTVDARTFAPTAFGAICDLLGGEQRIVEPVNWGDGFIINFNTRADEPWQEPSPSAPGWHKDGDWFRHFLDSPEQGLLTIIIWSDIQAQSGGTFVATDSVAPVARYLHQHPQGCHPAETQFGRLVDACEAFDEVTGEVGDVFLLHPFLLHAASNNPSGRARFITNPPVSLREPMCFSRADGDFSPVERGVLCALEPGPVDFRITGERERVVPERIARQQRMLAEQKARLRQA